MTILESFGARASSPLLLALAPARLAKDKSGLEARAPTVVMCVGWF